MEWRTDCRDGVPNSPTGGRLGIATILCVVVLLLRDADASLQQESFDEELLLYPLPDNRVLAHFVFVTRGPASDHGTLVRPAAVGLARGLLPGGLQAMELSLTRGRWLPSWGASPLREAQPGAELFATFGGNTTGDDGGSAAARQQGQRRVAGSWATLTQTLSGMFCASIGQLRGSERLLARNVLASALSSPSSSSPSSPSSPSPSSSLATLVYGSLPGEAVCTENLTPWLKLLPCGDAEGLAALLADRAMLYEAEYHSMRLALEVSPPWAAGATPWQQQQHGETGQCISGGAGGGSDGHPWLSLTQTMTVVLPRSATADKAQRAARGGLLSAVFRGQAPSGRCPPASTSRVWLSRRALPPDYTPSSVVALPGYGELAAVDLPLLPTAQGLQHERQHSRLAAAGLPIAAQWEDAAQESPWPRAPVRVQQYVAGRGDFSGVLVIEVMAPYPLPSSAGAGGASSGVGSASSGDNRDGDPPLLPAGARLQLVQVVPWVLQLWVHTMEVVLDGQRVDWQQHSCGHALAPASPRASPTVLHLCLLLPRAVGQVQLRAAFQKGFLRVSEYPPDAERGLDIPAAQVQLMLPPPRLLVPSPRQRQQQPGGAMPTEESSGAGAPEEAKEGSPLVRSLQSLAAYQACGAGALATLATPDFSMPYNVNCITCTLLALYVGGVYNMLLRRSSDANPSVEARRKRRRRQLLLLALVVLPVAAAVVMLDSSVQQMVVQIIPALKGPLGLQD